MAAAAEPRPDAVRDLRAELEHLDLPDEEIEFEREMLEGLERLVEFSSAVARGGLPVVETGHRAIGPDVCHFSAPASMPEEASQPSGRLLLTSARAVFVGGGRSVALPWHAAGRALQSERDLVLVRTDGSAIYRFRCNSFEEALRAGFVARRLAARRV